MKAQTPETHYKNFTTSGDKTASGNLISKPHKYSYPLSDESQSLCQRIFPELTKTASGVTFDGYQDFTWDAENRLTSIEVRDALVPAGAPKYRIEFSYDYSGRRIATKTFGGGAGNWTLANETKYIYDGWNCIAEFSGTGLISKSYLWGLDLSGSMQGAGGVGGLLSIEQHLGDGASRHYVAYDGNGNVVGLADADSGEMSALYEYSAFGEVLQMEGVYAVKNDYRFSTKPQEGMTGLYYYGYRFYDAGQGRWLSRDPIGERGGLNLYAPVDNDLVNYVDYIGLFPFGQSALRKQQTGGGPYKIKVKKCQVAILVGHGWSKDVNGDGKYDPGDTPIPHEFEFDGNCSAGAFAGCFAKTTNSKIPKNNKIPNSPSNKGLIKGGGGLFNPSPLTKQFLNLKKSAQKTAEDFCDKCCEEVELIIFFSSGGDAALGDAYSGKAPNPTSTILNCKTKNWGKGDH